MAECCIAKCHNIMVFCRKQHSIRNVTEDCTAPALFVLAYFLLSFAIFVRTNSFVHVRIISYYDHILPYSSTPRPHTMYMNTSGVVSLHQYEPRTMKKEVCPLPRGSRCGSVETCRNACRSFSDGREADAGGPLCQS